jgi:hypothetical protein
MNPLQQLRVMPEHTEDVERLAVVGQRAGERVAQLGVRHVIEVDRFDPWFRRSFGHRGPQSRGGGLRQRYDPCSNRSGAGVLARAPALRGGVLAAEAERFDVEVTAPIQVSTRVRTAGDLSRGSGGGR